MKGKKLGLAGLLTLGAGAIILLAPKILKADSSLDIHNFSWDIGKGEYVKVDEGTTSGEYLRGPARELRMYGWGPTIGNLTPHAISPIGIESNKAYVLELRLEAETCPDNVNNCIYLNHFKDSPLDPSKRNFFMRQHPNSPRKGTPEADPKVYDLLDLTNYFTQNAQIQLPTITSATPRTPAIYDKWQLAISNYADISPSVVDGNLPDGKVDVNDLSVLKGNWLRIDCNAENHWCGGADLTRDGKSNFIDYALFSSQWFVDPNTYSKDAVIPRNSDFSRQQQEKFYAENSPNYQKMLEEKAGKQLYAIKYRELEGLFV